jgi:hypothetical protein
LPREFMKVENWGTIGNMHPSLAYHRPLDGYMNPGPWHEIETDFSKLTEAQKDILKKETAYYNRANIVKRIRERIVEIGPMVSDEFQILSLWEARLILGEHP